MEAAVRTTDVLTAFRRATRSSFWLLCADVYPALVAASIPWSTTAVAAFMIIWLVVLLPTIDHREFLGSLKQPAYWLPLAFVVLVMLGMLWSDASWPERLRGVSPAAKLLAIPLLLYHFQRSQRGHWVFVAFLLSCTVLMLASWSVLYAPDWRMTHWSVPGVPIKNAIDQSQEFGLCIFALCPVALTLFGQRRLAMAAACAALILALFANLMFVAIARTALVFMPVLLMLFALKYLDRRVRHWRCSAPRSRPRSSSGRHRLICGCAFRMSRPNTVDTRSSISSLRPVSALNGGANRWNSLAKLRSSETAPVQSDNCSNATAPCWTSGACRSRIHITRH